MRRARAWLAGLGWPDRAGLAVALGGALLVLASAWLLRRTYGGDPSIYLSYARNAADGNPFQYNPGEFSSGSTSPLWALVLALPYLVCADAEGAKLVSAAVTLAAFGLCVWAAWRAAGSLLAAAVAALFVVTVLSLNGLLVYESGLIVALVAATVPLGLRVAGTESPGARDLAPLAVVWGAMILTRPESVILVGLQCLVLGWTAFGHRPRELVTPVAAAALAAIPAAIYYGYSLAELGTPSTSTQGRAFQFRELDLERLGPLYLDSGALSYVTSAPAVWAMIAALAGLAVLARSGPRWLALYAGGGILAYLGVLTLVTPGSYDTERYLLPVAPLVVVAAAHALRAARAHPAALVAAGAIGVLIAVDAVQVPVDIRDRDRSRYELRTIVHGDAADRLNELAAPGDTVLAYEVQIRYALRDDLDVLSLDGITDGKVHDYAERDDITGFLMRYRPRWWVLDTSTDPGGRPYLGRSVLGRAARQLIADPRRTRFSGDGIDFDVAFRRTGELPYRTGAWRMVVELRYPDGA